MMTLRYVGLDVHKDSISVAVADVGDAAAQVLERLPFDEAAGVEVVANFGAAWFVKGLLGRGRRGMGCKGS
ncbi:MAG: hypothetical protein R3C01_15530 [Planctomycetaceae bacterium]